MIRGLVADLVVHITYLPHNGLRIKAIWLPVWIISIFIHVCGGR